MRLQFPALFSTYAALLAYMAEIHAARLCRLPDDLLRHLMAAVDLGLTSDAGPDIARACLELVASLAAHVCTDPALHGTMVYQVGAHFLEVLLDWFSLISCLILMQCHVTWLYIYNIYNHITWLYHDASVYIGNICYEVKTSYSHKH